MEWIACETPDQRQLDGVWQLLLRYGEDFVPPLSRRNSTCQQALRDGDASAGRSPGEPAAYFEELRHQQFLLAMDGERVAAFLSYRRDHVPEILAGRAGAEVLGLYVTTLIVDASCRRQGVARRLYRLLMTLETRRRRLLSTRTWSGNAGHIALLRELAFSGPVRIPDDRGPGIDTVYYYKLLEEEAP